MTVRSVIGNARAVSFGHVVRNVNVFVDGADLPAERYIAGEHLDEEDSRVRRWGWSTDDDFPPTFKRRFAPGQTLLHSRNPSKVAVPHFPGITGEKLFILVPYDSEQLLPAFLPLLLQSKPFKQFLSGALRGSVNKYLNWTQLSEFEVYLPPIDAQRQAASVIDAALTVGESYRQGQSSLGFAKRALLAHLFENDLAASPRVRLDAACTMQSGRPFPSAEYCEDGIRLLRPGNLGRDGTLEWPERATQHLPSRYATEATNFLVHPGNVVINLTAQSLEDGFMGRVCLARKGDECLLNQRIGRFVCSDEIRPEYLFRVLQSRPFRRVAETRCGGSKVRHLYWRHIENFEFPLPSLTEQDELIRRCRSLDALGAHLETLLDAIGAVGWHLRESLWTDKNQRDGGEP